VETKMPPTSGEEATVETERSLIARLVARLTRPAPPSDGERRAADLLEDDDGSGVVE
jgi:hypothetical protein